MAGTLIFNGPLPEVAGDHWCTLCAMIYKGAANTSPMVAALVSQVNALSEDDYRTVLMQDIPELNSAPKPQPAVAVFISPILQQLVGAVPVPVPLCWSHLMGLQLRPGGGVVPATPEQMPGGMNGAVDLSQRRGR